MNHKEAFCLMWFECVCGHKEQVWNSRDGVTPFGLMCPSCGGASLFHTRWHLDHPAPKHKPHPGQRFFRDGTADEAVEVVKKRLTKAKEADHPIPDAVAEVLLEDARNLTGEWHTGWPKVDRA